jgi:hypothetical protein
MIAKIRYFVGVRQTAFQLPPTSGHQRGTWSSPNVRHGQPPTAHRAAAAKVP